MFTNVTTGIRTEDMVEVLSGVKKGDSVVVSGVLFCRPKSPVKIRGVKTVEQLKQ
jgi:membrane fusion protein (multidrug efflux system)